MEARILTTDEFQVVGLEYCGRNENREIPQVWQDFVLRMDEVPHAADDEVCCGICRPIPGTTDVAYTAGLRVRDLSRVPTGMVARTIPAATYAVVTHRGPIDTFIDTYTNATGWLQSLGLRPSETHEIECYDSRFDGSEESEMDLYIPIQQPS